MSTSVLIAIFLGLYLLTMWKADRVFPIIYLFFFLYFVQYIFSTYLIYFEYEELKYEMTIRADRYFDFAIPAIIALFSGALLFNKDVDIRNSLKRIDASDANKYGYFLLIISYFFDLLSWAGMTSIESIVTFTSYLKYLAAFCFLFSNSIINYFIIALIYLQLAAQVLAAGVFVSFYIWSLYLFFFTSLKFKLAFWMRTLFIVLVIPIVVSVQAIKNEYRKQTWSGKKEAGIQLLTDLLEKDQRRGEQEQALQSHGVVSTVGRLTQGWHLGLVLKQVPSKVAHSNGQEMMSDILSSILPRVFFPEKKTINSQAKFYKYTGHKIRGNTSMSVGVLGDFYLNFGKTGSYIALFILGAFVSWFLWYFLTHYVLNDPLNIIWVPFILTYLIRANNDFYTFFNGMIKGFILFLVFDYIRKYFKGQKSIIPYKPISS